MASASHAFRPDNGTRPPDGGTWEYPRFLVVSWGYRKTQLCWHKGAQQNKEVC